LSNGNFGCLTFYFADVSVTEFPLRAEW
jgi:hypothetical protein